MSHSRYAPSARPGGGTVPSLAPRLPAPWARRAAIRQELETGRWLFILLLHVPLVLAIKSSPLIATVHAVGTLAVGLRCLSYRSPERLVYMMGYILASEPLWRVAGALIFHETAKYAIAGLSILAVLKYRTLRSADKTTLIYFALLLPSILVLPEFDRQAISFNLSGPFALTASALFLSSLRFPPPVLSRLFLTILAPITGYVFLASFSTFTAEEFNAYSKAATGGLGQNQASSIFGLGALCAFLYVSIAPRPRPLRWIVAGLGLWCGVQGALTFSRGGVATTVGAIAATSFFLLGDRRFRGAVVVRVVLIALIAVFAAVPFLNAFTSGGFQYRFTNTELTGRDKIIEADFIAFQENPVFGVGPGQSMDYHALTFRRSAAHTEYSRLLAEHGSLGLAALALLAWMSMRRLLRSSSVAGKALAAGFTVWALLFMFHAAMRMAAVSFIFALGSSHLMGEAPRSAPGRRRASPGSRHGPPDGRTRSSPSAGLARSPPSVGTSLQSAHRRPRHEPGGRRTGG